MRGLLALLMCLPLAAELNDPGAGLPTTAQRRTARLAVWQPAWEGFDAAQKANFGYDAYYDMARPHATCMLDEIRKINNNPAMTVAEVKTWIEGEFALQELSETMVWADAHCASPTQVNWTSTGGDGGTRDVVLVIATRTVAKALRNMLPCLPRIGTAQPIMFGSPNIEVSPGTRVAYRWPAEEVHLHMMEAIVRAEGAIAAFSLRYPAPAVYDAEGGLVTPEVTALPADWNPPVDEVK